MWPPLAPHQLHQAHTVLRHPSLTRRSVSFFTVFGENVTTIFKPTGTGRILEQIGQGLPRAADDFKNFLESVASQTAAHNHTLYGNPIWNYFDPAA